VTVGTHWPWLLAAMSVPPLIGYLLSMRREPAAA
jgi:hypothetical protein